MRMLAFSKRTAKEIMRDPLNLCFGIGFPIVILLLLTAIQHNAPIPLFRIQSLTPGIAVFGFSFFTLFSATLVSKDRESAFLQRLYTTPLTASDYVLGYLLPILPLALMQTTITFAVAILLGLKVTPRILLSILAILPSALMFISLGLLCGSVLSSKQAGGICGALLTNLCAWLSGTWFDIKLVGGAFEKIANVLPFVHGVELVRTALNGGANVLPHLLWVMGYTVIITGAAVFLFLKQMKKQ